MASTPVSVCVDNLIETSELASVKTVSGRYFAGVTDGTSPAAGQVGEHIFTSIASTTSVTSDNTDVAVAGASIALTPGVWRIGYHVPMGLVNLSGGNASVSCRVRLKDTSGSVLSGTSSYVSNSQVPSGAVLYSSSFSTSVVISIDTAETYTLNAAKGGSAGADKQARVAGSSFDATLDDDDSSSRVFATRIA